MKIIGDNETIFYFDEHRKFHREDGPAIIFKDGITVWFFHDKLLNEEGPTVCIWRDNEE
jgi:hypothetical protein